MKKAVLFLVVILLAVSVFIMDRQTVRAVQADGETPTPTNPYIGPTATPWPPTATMVVLPTDIPVDTPMPTWTPIGWISPTPTFTATPTLIPYTKEWCDAPGRTAHLWDAKSRPPRCMCQVPEGNYITCVEYDKIY